MPRDRVTLIAGATGLVNGELIELLLDSEYVIRFVSLVRRPSGRSHAGLDERQIVFDLLESLHLGVSIGDAAQAQHTSARHVTRV